MTLISPVLTYGTETQTIAKLNERQLLIFERKILQKICGVVCEKIG